MIVESVVFIKGLKEVEEKEDGDKSRQSNENEKEEKILVTKEDIVALISKLKSSSGKVVYTALHKIRNKIIQNDVGISMLHECGGFKYLVKLLSVSSEEVLNIILSILGNCCSRLVSNQDLRDEVI